MQEDDKYKLLIKHLSSSYKKINSFTFKQIENMIGSELPIEAYENSEFWDDNGDSELVLAVHNAKFKVEQLNISQQCVMFVKE